MKGGKLYRITCPICKELCWTGESQRHIQEVGVDDEGLFYVPEGFNVDTSDLMCGCDEEDEPRKYWIVEEISLVSIEAAREEAMHAIVHMLLDKEHIRHGIALEFIEDLSIAALDLDNYIGGIGEWENPWDLLGAYLRRAILQTLTSQPER